MDEIKIRDEQLKQLDEELSALFAGLEKSKRRDLDVIEIGEKVHDYNNALDCLKMELRSHKDKAEFTARAKTYGTNLRKFKNDLEWAEKNSTKNALMEGARGEQAAKMNTAEGLMDHGLKTQEASKDALVRITQKVGETRDIGVATAAQLAKQTDQLEHMYDDLQDINSTLQRSTVIIKRMTRKLKTDKYMWVMSLLVMGVIVAIIIYKIAVPTANVNAPDSLLKDGQNAVPQGPKVTDVANSVTGRRLLRMFQHKF